ncbi:Fasciclin-like arabinogalactan protein [Colletotrichum viniferum]|nr:Fasciclin-like arabinogalactan protein [Colletotrichum viniferum]
MHSRILSALAILPCLAAGESLKHVLASHGSLTMLHDLLVELDLLGTFEAVKNSTLIAMNDDAFEYLANWGMNLSSIDPELARGIMRYHFLEGSYTSTNPLLGLETQLIHSVLRPPVLTNVSDGAVVKLTAADNENPFRVECGLQKVLPIVEADVYYDTGVLHTINENLVLPHNLSETTNLGNLEKFWSLVKKAQMSELLESLRDTTIMLPSNEAMEKYKFHLESLAPEDLRTTINNHVIPNRVLYHLDFGDTSEEATAMSGLKLKLSRHSADRLFVNHARVLKQDVLIYGGVSHVLDNVLLTQRGSYLNVENDGLWRYVVSLRWYKYPWKNTTDVIFGAALLFILGALVIQRVVRWKTSTYQHDFGGCITKEGVVEETQFRSSVVYYYVPV